MVAVRPVWRKGRSVPDMLPDMPVIVIGADTEVGTAIVDALLGRAGEIRAFVTDPATGAALKKRGVKVATGDISDGSHVASASLNTFSAVVVPEAAFDDRERSFAADPAAVLQVWAEALAEAGVRRVIWLEDDRAEGVPAVLSLAAAEVATVETARRQPDEIAATVVHLDDAARI